VLQLVQMLSFRQEERHLRLPQHQVSHLLLLLLPHALLLPLLAVPTLHSATEVKGIFIK
jgi:hypothetical protein